MAKENTDEDWDVVEAPVPPPKKAVPPLPRRNSARTQAPAEPVLPPALKAPAKATPSAKAATKARAKTATPKAAGKAADRKVTPAARRRGKVPEYVVYAAPLSLLH